MFGEIMDWIVKARTDVHHASRLLAQWDLRTEKGSRTSDYSLLVNLIREANEALDRVVSGMVKESTNVNDAEESIPPGHPRPPTISRSRPS